MVPLWRQDTFRWLWIGQTCAQLAAQVSFLAVPLVATIALEATPGEMGLLTAVGAIPSLVLGLQAGALIDYRARRPVMMATDLARAALLASIPFAWMFDLLTMGLLYTVVLLGGCLALFFDVAYQTYLASILEPEQRVEGNSKLELSRTAAEFAGPGLAGHLVQWVGAPLTLLTNAALYLASFYSIWRIRQPERIGSGPVDRLRYRVRDGVRAVWQSRPARTVASARGMIGFFNAMLEAVFVLFVVRVLDVGPAMLGIIFGLGGSGFLVGALLPERLNTRLGLGRATAMALALAGASDLLVPLAEGARWAVVPLLVAAQFCFGLGVTVFNVNVSTVRQAAIPESLQGRASATMRFVATVTIPVGAVCGGIMGETIGLRATLVIAALGEMGVALWLYTSPLRSYVPIPTPADAGTTG